MAILSTGPIENNAVNGVRPTVQVTVKIDNRDAVNPSAILIQGYNLTLTRTLYVSELITVSPDEVITRNYFANLNAYEFVFTTGVLLNCRRKSLCGARIQPGGWLPPTVLSQLSCWVLKRGSHRLRQPYLCCQFQQQ